MTAAAPSDALDCLLEEQRQIEDLLAVHALNMARSGARMGATLAAERHPDATHPRSGDAGAAGDGDGDGDADEATESGRVATLIFTLLRVHAALEGLLQQALVREAGAHPALVRNATRRATVMDTLDRVQALPLTDVYMAEAMAGLARQVQAWFETCRQDLFDLARHSLVDLVALDREMAARQEAMLGAG